MIKSMQAKHGRRRHKPRGAGGNYEYYSRGAVVPV